MRSGFFNSDITGWDEQTGLPNFDRAEDAEFLAKFFSVLSENGIYAKTGFEYLVFSQGTNGMTALVGGGIAVINGIMAWEENARTIVFQASESLDRIDRVVLRLDLSSRKIDIFVKKGTASTSPVAPALTRPEDGQSGDIYELGLADVLIPKNSTTVIQSRITDTRLNSSLCGLIYPRMPQVDTTAIFKQIQASVDEHMELVQSAIDGTTAGNLSNRIKSPQATITLTASLWQGSEAPFTFRVHLSGVTATSNQDVTFTPDATKEQIKALQIANIVGGEQGTGYFVLRAFGKKPTIDVPLIVVRRGEK